MSKTDPQTHLATRKLQRETRARVEASGLVAPCWMCGAPHFQRESSNLDQLQHNGTPGFPSHTKDNVRERAKAKERGEKGRQRKRKGPTVLKWWVSTLGTATCRTGTRTVTRQSWSHCAQRCVRNVTDEDEQGWRW